MTNFDSDSSFKVLALGLVVGSRLLLSDRNLVPMLWFIHFCRHIGPRNLSYVMKRAAQAPAAGAANWGCGRNPHPAENAIEGVPAGEGANRPPPFCARVRF